jgi:hypothetical protein
MLLVIEIISPNSQPDIEKGVECDPHRHCYKNCNAPDDPTLQTYKERV